MFPTGAKLLGLMSCVLFSLNPVQAQISQTVNNGGKTSPIALPGGGCSYKWTVTDNAQIGFPTTSGTGDVPSFTAVNNTNKPITAHISLTPSSDGFAYVANSQLNLVNVVNTATGNAVTNVPVDTKPYGVAVAPDGRRVYVVNSKNGSGHPVLGTIYVIDATSNTVIDNYTVGVNPTSIAINPAGTRAYVVNQGDGNISVLDLTPNKTTLPKITVSGATDIAMSADGSLIYVCSSTEQLYVIDATTSQILKKIPFQSTYPTAMVLTPDGSKVYVTNNTSNYICAIDVTTGDSQNIVVGIAPFALAVTPDGRKVYVTNAISNDVSVINTANNRLIKTLAMPSLPQGITVSPNGKHVFVAEQDPNQLQVIDAGTDQFETPIPLGPGAAISVGRFVTAGIGCNTMPVVYSITVNPPPSIDDPGSVAASSTHYGTASTSQVINVSGTSLTAPITVTAPTGYEVSKDDITFKDTVMVGAAGNVTATEVFIRLKASAQVNIYHGNIQLSSPGAATVAEPTDGTVLTTQLNITANNSTKFIGDPLPVLTVTYTGFVNGDNASQLTKQPVVTTTATAASSIGKYPITVSGASAKNYVITYVAGTLEVVTGNISTPNAFTPNGDGVNDTWDIKNLNLYAECTVEVLNRYGQKVFYTNGYPAPWNGTFNGQQLPVGTYYYIIKLKPGAKPLTGPINIIR